MLGEQLLKQLAQSLNLPNLAFNGQGCARIVFNGKVDVDIEHDHVSGELNLSTNLGSMPATGGEALYLSLLQANLRGQQTLGATLAVDEIEHQIVLNRTLLVRELAVDDLLDVFQRFCASAGYWQQTLGYAPSGDTAPDVPTPAPASSGFLRA
jgi:hypothetical protein